MIFTLFKKNSTASTRTISPSYTASSSAPPGLLPLVSASASVSPSTSPSVRTSLSVLSGESEELDTSRSVKASRQLCKPETKSRVCITVSNSPNPSRVYIRLCKHGKRLVFYCLIITRGNHILKSAFDMRSELFQGRP